MIRYFGLTLALALLFMMFGAAAVEATTTSDPLVAQEDDATPTLQDVDLGISPGTRNVTWEGGTVEFSIRTTGVAGYDGNVNLELCSPPAGISGTFEPNPVPAGEFSTLTLTTETGRLVPTEIDLLIGGHGDRERSACGNTDRGIRDSVDASLMVQRTNGDFVVMDAPISESSMAACETEDAIIATRERAAGNTNGVEFLNNGRRVGTRVVAGAAWAVSPGCRAGYVVSVDGEGDPAAAGVFNLGFPANLTGRAPGGQRVSIPYAPTEVYFSPDDSVVVVVGEVTDEDGDTEQILQAYDLFSGGQVGTDRPFDSPIASMEMTNNRIDILLESGRGLSAINLRN